MRIRCWVVVLVAGLAIAPVTWADEAYDKLVEGFGEAETRWYEQMEAASKAKDGESVPAVDMTKRPAIEFVPRFRAYAEKHAGKPAAIPALAWLIDNSVHLSLPEPKNDELPPTEWALQRLTQDHAGQSEIKESLGGLAYAAYSLDKEGLVRLYEKIISTNKNKDAQSQAMFNLGFTYYLSSRRGDDAERNAATKLSTDTFRRVIKVYPESKAAEKAAPYIYEIEHLQIGMVAPEIVGKNASGKEIKLSQFRGQVVVLGFWGFW